MSGISYGQTGIDSDEVGEMFLGNHLSKLKPWIFTPLVSRSNEIK